MLLHISLIQNVHAFIFLPFNTFQTMISSSLLFRYTLWDEIDFRIKEMLPSRFQLMNGPITIEPGRKIRVPDNGKAGVLGFYLHCPQNGEIA